jgi:hypothetical protein
MMERLARAIAIVSVLFGFLAVLGFCGYVEGMQ